jgi:hypothetical protein
MEHIVKSPDIDLSPSEAKALAKRAFTVTFPWCAMYHTMGKMTMDPETGQPFSVGINQVVYNDSTFSAKDRTMPMVNSSNFTAGPWIDLRDDPVIITVPATDDPDRYYSCMIADGYHYIDTPFGSRLGNVIEERKVLFFSAFSNWDGVLPDGVDEVIEMETAFGTVGLRLGVNASSEGDVEAARRVMRGMQLQTLNEYMGKPQKDKPHLDWVPIGDDYIDMVTGPHYFEIMEFVINLVTPHPNDAAEWQNLDRLGMGQGDSFDASRYTPETLAAIKAGMVEGLEEVAATPLHSAAGMFKSRKAVDGGEADYYVRNTQAAYFGLIGQPNYEVNYVPNMVDADGDEMDGGKHSYTIRYEAGAFPPVNAFWAYTLYQKPDLYLYDNVQDKYTIDTLQGYEADADGGLTVHVAHDRPAGVPMANWLPAPAGPFMVLLRMYNPQESGIDGSWTQAPIKKA